MPLATKRVSASVPPPAGNGTTIFTGRDGIVLRERSADGSASASAYRSEADAIAHSLSRHAAVDHPRSRMISA